MTNTTDIAVLYAIAARAKETGTSFVIPAETALSMLKHIGALRDNLEAERQRSDEMTEQYLDRNSALTSATLRYEKAEAELAALRGTQEPVAFLIHEKAKPSRLSFQNLKGFVNPKDIEEHELWQELLFTNPPKPVVVHPDTVRMDWLCAHVVEVRQSMFYGSHAMFFGQCDSADDEEYHSKLREQIDAAIKAAGIVVKDGE